MKRISILGSTGSIGVSTLDVIARHPDKYKVIALTANSQIDRLFEQCVQFQPRYAVLLDADAAEKLSVQIRDAGLATEVLHGHQSLEFVAAHPEVDSVMAAIVGAAGLLPTLAAARAGKQILLANKETLVMAGQIFIDAANENNAQILPIDSEHNAIFQSLPVGYGSDASLRKGIKRILLTASGGPFREVSLDALTEVTPDQACAHPNWVMGRKISVDSATMMNKGLEVIEAHWLFAVAAERIQVVIHPQSVVHSMVEYLDGSVLAQLGNPDMRTPIAHALAYPERIDAGVSSLDLFKIGSLTFTQPDFTRFPCLRLAYDVLGIGGTAPAILNAANEIAVAKFLEGSISFLQIPELIESVLETTSSGRANKLGDVLDADTLARANALEWANAVCA